MLAMIAAAAAIVVLYTTYRLTRVSNLPGLPRIGKPGFIGFISTAFRFTFDSQNCIDEGWAQFSGRPFMVPSLAGSIIVLGPEHVEILRASNDTVFNQPLAVNEMLQMDYTMDEHQHRNPFQAAAVRSDLTRAIASLIPEIVEETTLAMAETFKPPVDSKSITLPLFSTMTHMVSRVSNRAVVGTELCRNNTFLHAIVNFAETLVVYAIILNALPRPVRSAAYFVLSSLFGGKKEPAKFITPYIEECLLKREESDERPNNIVEFIIRHAPPAESVQRLAIRVMNVNFGSTHTSAIVLTQTIFELASLSASDLDAIRAEITHALEVEGGWNKPALARFYKIDSLLREVARVHGLGCLGLQRLTIQPAPLPSGVVIPAGYNVAVNLKPIHRNPDIYPNPDVFDPFRFSRLRNDQEGNVKWGFTNVDRNYLPFGAGRHACPGRFFVAMELKVMLAHLLLNYDISFPAGITERPKNVMIHIGVLPDSKAKLVFTPRVSRVA